MKNIFSLLFLALLCQILPAQSDSDILMTIDNEQISADEFLRIYNKNSSITIEDKKSIDEYLDLFIDYKLKVIEAENLGYDTISTFITEMDGYAKQLATPYMNQSELIDSIVYQSYLRSLEEVNASHILLRADRDVLPKDSTKVYNRIMRIRDRIVSGEDWDAVIDDESPTKNIDDRIGGDLGWFTAFRMVYPFEVAAYNTPVGEVSMPVRTIFGYHLIKVNDRRENRGEIEMSHIMVLIPKNPNDLDIQAAKEKIDNAYQELEKGTPWDSVVTMYSEHRATIPRGGSLGYVKTGMGVPEELVKACYELEEGKYSEPIKTEYGFHIVKAGNMKTMPSFEQVKESYTNKVKNLADVINLTREKTIERIKNEYGFKLYEERLEDIYGVFDSTAFAGEWTSDKAAQLTDTLFYIGDSVYTQYDAAKVMGERRIAYKMHTPAIALRKRFFMYMNDKIEEYEIAQLPRKYPEYRYLLEEYHDGILLFNLTEDKVWNKAVEDSAGLQAYYNSLAEKYSWDERIALSKYTYSDSSLTDPLLKIAKKRVKKGMTTKEVSMKLCGQDTLPCVSIKVLKYEKGDNAVADGMTWQKGSYTITNDKDDVVLYYVDDILAPQTKELQEARGLYTADYQSHLEDIWVKELRDKYTIDINQDVLNRLKEQEQSGE